MIFSMSTTFGSTTISMSTSSVQKIEFYVDYVILLYHRMVIHHSWTCQFYSLNTDPCLEKLTLPRRPWIDLSELSTVVRWFSSRDWLRCVWIVIHVYQSSTPHLFAISPQGRSRALPVPSTTAIKKKGHADDFLKRRRRVFAVEAHNYLVLLLVASYFSSLCKILLIYFEVYIPSIFFFIFWFYQTFYVVKMWLYLVFREIEIQIFDFFNYCRWKRHGKSTRLLLTSLSR